MSVNPDGVVAKFDGKTFPCDMPHNKVQELVAKLVQKGDYEGAARYLLPATEYNLTEI